MTEKFQKIIEVCDVNSDGHKIRLADGTYRVIPHSTAELQVGQDYGEHDPDESERVRMSAEMAHAMHQSLAGPYPITQAQKAETQDKYYGKPPTLEQLNTPEQAE